MKIEVSPAKGATRPASSVALSRMRRAVVPTAKYRYCENLLKDWPNGVAENKAAANRAVREGFYRPASSAKARKVYRDHHSNLDRDDDGTACEQTA